MFQEDKRLGIYHASVVEIGVAPGGALYNYLKTILEAASPELIQHHPEENRIAPKVHKTHS